MRNFMVIALFILLPFFAAHAQSGDSLSHPVATVGTSSIAGKIEGVSIEVMVQGPSAEKAELQIACVFEYSEGDIFRSPPALPPAANGLFHLDEALHGLITDLRKSGKFTGHYLETLLIIPPTGTIGASKLLLIGLGNRNIFSPEIMVNIGRIGMREALRLGVTDYAHGSDLKDAGINSPTAIVAENVVKGAFEAYRTEQYLKGKNATKFTPLVKMTMLAGPDFYFVTLDSIKKAIPKMNLE